MYLFEYAEKDTVVYEGSATSSRNVGFDPILEVRKDMSDGGGTKNISRILIKFDLGEISSSVVDGVIPSDAKYYLNLYDAGSRELRRDDTIFAFPISASWSSSVSTWDEGDGRFDDNPESTQGCSWKYVDGDLARQQNKWVSGSSIEGPRWYSGSAEQYSLESTASIGKHSDTHDVRFDVSGIVKNWIYSGSTYVNHGFIVMRDGNFGATDTGSAEKDGIDRGHLKFFSTETNTIFPPRLEVEYDDSSFSTGSLLPLTGSGLEDAVIYTKNLRETYMEKSTPKIRIGARERFAERAVSTQSPYSTVKYLPSGSRDLKDGAYYSIKDADSDFTLVPFSTGSIISCDSDGNYFKVDMNSFQVDRVYKFIFKVISGSGTSEGFTNLYDDNYTFRVTK